MQIENILGIGKYTSSQYSSQVRIGQGHRIKVKVTGVKMININELNTHI